MFFNLFLTFSPILLLTVLFKHLLELLLLERQLFDNWDDEVAVEAILKRLEVLRPGAVLVLLPDDFGSIQLELFEHGENLIHYGELIIAVQIADLYSLSQVNLAAVQRELFVFFPIVIQQEFVKDVF